MDKTDGRDEAKSWTLFIDLKSAFDNVSHKQMFKKMEQMGINEELCNTIKWLYK